MSRCLSSGLDGAKRRPLDLARVVLVSNRVGDLSRSAVQAGGVAVLLAEVLEEGPALWFGWNGRIDAEPGGDISLQHRAGRGGRSDVVAVPLTADEHADYYLGYSNSVLWPVFHNRLDLARFDAGYYRSYLEVNERFAVELARHLKADDIIWVHDFHLIPIAQALRRLGVRNSIGFFLHIPLPPSEAFLAIPEHMDLLDALASYDLVGLQTKADVGKLIGIYRDSGLGSLQSDGRMRVASRPLAIESFPVGIRLADFAKPKRGHAANGADGRVRIVGVDRLDYTKGLPQKFAAYGRFLERFPDYRGRVVLSQIAPPTRESVEAYTKIRRTLEALSGQINGMFGELDWVPIQYIYRTVARAKLVDLYRTSRVALITPLRDGMNLVAKEYIAAQNAADPGVLILSRFAGAAEDLKDALIVNPYNLDELADNLRIALEMSLEERCQRHQRLIEVIKRQDTRAWQTGFLTSLEVHAAKRMTEESEESRAGAGVARALDRLSSQETAFHLAIRTPRPRGLERKAVKRRASPVSAPVRRGVN